MYRTALRSASRPALNNTLRTSVRAAPRRFASTASPADKSRSWKGSAARWGLAVAAVYYYNTSSVFADEATPQTVHAPAPFGDDDLPTVDSVIEEKRKQIRDKLEKPREPKPAETQPQADAAAAETVAVSPAGLEEDAGQQGAFNPETGEINWDCPCLGGMADGPCGEEFKTAFSCFVYSNEEPKGMDCIDKFQGMQECFRKYPEIYGGELTDDDANEAGDAPVPEHQVLREDAPAAAVAVAATDATAATVADVAASAVEAESKPESNDAPAPKSETAAAAPKWEDATSANEAVKAEKKE